MVLFVIERRQK